MYCGGGGAAAHEQSRSRANREILFISPAPGAQQARHLDRWFNDEGPRQSAPSRLGLRPCQDYGSQPGDVAVLSNLSSICGRCDTNASASPAFPVDGHNLSQINGRPSERNSRCWKRRHAVTLLDLALIAGDPLGDEALDAKLFGVDVEAVMNGLRANDRVGFCRSARVRKWPQPAVRGSTVRCRQWRAKRTVDRHDRHRRI